MKCGHCKLDFEEKDIQEHHCHPRFMDNSRGVGLKVGLCGKCHNILHGQIARIIWNILTPEQKEKTVLQVSGYSEIYGGVNHE